MAKKMNSGVDQMGGTMTRRSLLRTAAAAAGATAVASHSAATQASAFARSNALGLAPSSLVAGRSVATLGQSATSSGSLTLAQSTDIHEMDPHRELWSDDSSVHFAIFDSLVQRDDKMNLVPVLAESYENTGPTEWTFKLKPGVTFHNGEPLTVETIQWNVEDAIAPGKKRDVSFANFDHVEKVDEQTFKLHTKAPDPLVPQKLIRFFILPAKYYQEKGEDGFMAAPIGSGPYKFVERAKDNHIKVTAHEGYWRGNAHIKDVNFRIIPDASTSLEALKAGEVDFMFALPPDQSAAINSGGNTKAASVVSDRVAYTQFFPESPLGKGELKDPRVRQAINYGVNIDNIIKYLLADQAKRISTGLPPLSFAYDKALKPYPYDPEKAKSLLAAAGFAKGFDLTLEVPSSFILAKPNEIGQAMQADLQKIGLTVNLKVTELATMVTERSAKKIAPMYLWSWGSDFLDPEPTYRGILYTKSPYTFYGKAAWDKLIDDAAVSLDQTTRQKIYLQLQRETFDDPPWLFMYAVENIYGLNKQVQFTPRTDERVLVWQMQKNAS
jgi:peptide/nickel transport system substrate-binding protein